MEGNLFYGQRPLFVLIELSMAFLVAAVVGFVIGRLVRQRVTDNSQIGAIQASILGMLALMLGFTFGVASSRYDTRRGLAIDEANAVGTTFLRAQALPEPYRTRTSEMLLRYIELRVEIESVINDSRKIAEVMHKTKRLQQQIWGEAAAVGREYPNDITGLFLESLNESIDLTSSRKAWHLARVPDTIMCILALIAVAGLGITGYGFGISGQRSWLIMALVSVLVAAVIVMIVDLDRPEAGPTRESQQTMADVLDSLPGFAKSGREAGEAQ